MYATSYATATPLAAALVRVGGREPVGGLPSGGRWQLACSASATSGRCRCLRFLLPCELHVVRICLFTRCVVLLHSGPASRSVVSFAWGTFSIARRGSGRPCNVCGSTIASARP